MTMLIVVATLIALMGFALARHWKVREDKSVKNARRARAALILWETSSALFLRVYPVTDSS